LQGAEPDAKRDALGTVPDVCGIKPFDAWKPVNESHPQVDNPEPSDLLSVRQIRSMLPVTEPGIDAASLASEILADADPGELVRFYNSRASGLHAIYQRRLKLQRGTDVIGIEELIERLARIDNESVAMAVQSTGSWNIVIVFNSQFNQFIGCVLAPRRDQ
jgi:hypothetical protein